MGLLLGFIVTAGSIQMDLTKVSAVTAWPQPTTGRQMNKELRNDLGGDSEVYN